MKRLLVCLFACVAAAHADEIVYSGYMISDNSNNSVATTAFSLAKTLWSRTMILMDVELDQTTVPPLEDAVTGASRPTRQSKSEFRKNRGQILAGLGQDLGENTRVTAQYYFSQEPDYQSQAVIASLTQDFLQKNFTVSLRAQYTYDSVGEILDNGSVRNAGKETHRASLILTQLLSPRSILRGGADAVRRHGLLSDPYRKVEIPGTADTVIERHPNMHFQYAVWSEITQYLAPIDGAFIVKYRYYWDDWGMKSNTADFQFNKYLTKNWIFTPQYRYYDETKANFEGYGSTGTYDAVDYKLQQFGSNGAGAALTCFLKAFSRNHPTWDFLNNSSVSALYLHYFNDLSPTHYSADLVQGSLKFTF
ncbi:MAG: lipoprotein [Fibrobacteres bacterium]|nr:lipoprotein [Fibrobacterota bacterium]